MQIVSGTEKFCLDGKSAVVIGKFDGLHRGHRLLLSRILEAKKEGLLAAVFTFDPSPAAFFSPQGSRELTTREEKRHFFGQLGVDVLVEFPLNRRSAAMPPELFIREILCDSMHAAFVAAGEDLSFGQGGRGGCRLLRAFQKQGGYRVEIVEKVMDGGAPISSTRVRDAVQNGRMEEAGRLLGAPYAIMGKVVRGRQLGRTLGFPTVNQVPPESKLLPPYGVYWSEVECAGGIFQGLTNIGVRPTVAKTEEKTAGVETYLYDFRGDMYDSFLTVRLLSFCRPEQKFDSLAALREQLAKDIAAGRERKIL